MNNMELSGELDDSDIEVCVVDDDESTLFHPKQADMLPISAIKVEPEEDQTDDFSTLEIAVECATDVSRTDCDANLNEHSSEYTSDLDTNILKKSSSKLCRTTSTDTNSNTEPQKHTQSFHTGDNQPAEDVDMPDLPDSQGNEEDSANFFDSFDGSGGEDNDEEDNDEDEEDLNSESQNTFYFESDHLAFKHNKDYKLLLKTLLVLEAQRIRAVKDLEDLYKWKETALKEPIAFVESLQSKNPPTLPQRQPIAALPQMDWMHYLTASSSMKLPPGFLTNTRRSFRTKGDSNEPQVKSESVPQEESEVLDSELGLGSSQEKSGQKNARGRLLDDGKVLTFNRLWTTEEQERLEKLLTVYPPEDIEARRWEKIARALGNRTPKQVSSRVQKYFIKLARAGLPIPGRAPHMHSQKKSRINPVSFRNSTFFPSWKPSVCMNEDDDDTSSVTTTHSDDTPCVSDEEMFPSDLKQTAEYKELVNLKKYKRQLEEGQQGSAHTGYRCDACEVDPIRGVRWHCTDCPADASVDFCSSCTQTNPEGFPKLHPAWHRMISFEEHTAYLDGDYLAFELQHGKYNYLDPNFIPKAR